MAHKCPACGMTCHCNGDLGDIWLDLEANVHACTHCDDEDNFEYEFSEEEFLKDNSWKNEYWEFLEEALLEDESSEDEP